ncbi:MAG TPA: hypothetical protein VM409_00415 [Chloroflexia bacterium]|nr:hypothetical protein [Chloroflexia bacterium]
MNSVYSPVVDRLLTSREPWVVYNTLVDLAGTEQYSPEESQAYEAIRAHPLVIGLIDALEEWPPARPLGKAYDPKDTIWKLATLADFGLRRDDERIAATAERVFAAQSEEGGFLHGGFDHTKSWHARPYICISHVMTYALARFGYLDDQRLQRAYDHITAWQRLDGGWHPNKLNLPGGERESEPSCPFGTLNVLRALVANPAMRDGETAFRAADNLLSAWERRTEPYRPVGFGIGSSWDKVIYPFVQYGLLKEIDTLSQISKVRSDPRYKEMLKVLKGKLDAEGTLTAESVNKPYAEFDFGQKKQPSAWLTFLAVRVLVRSED